MYTRVGAGLYPSYKEAAAQVIVAVGRFDPDSTAGAVYDQAFRRPVDFYESLDMGVF